MQRHLHSSIFWIPHEISLPLKVKSYVGTERRGHFTMGSSSIKQSSPFSFATVNSKMKGKLSRD